MTFSHLWCQSGTEVNGSRHAMVEPRYPNQKGIRNRDKTFVRSNQPKTTKTSYIFTYPSQDTTKFLGYELQHVVLSCLSGLQLLTLSSVFTESVIAPNSSAVCIYVCMVITYSRVWINRLRLPILLVVS